MNILAALSCFALAVVNGFIFMKIHTDTSYIVANIFIAAGIICAGLGLKK